MTILQAILIIVGLIMYVLSKEPKIQEIGRIMFWTALLSFLLGGKFPLIH